MTGNPSGASSDWSVAFELKAASFTLPIIRLLRADIEAVAVDLGKRVEQAPEFFHNTPVVIDLSGFPTDGGEVEFPLLVGLLRGYGMIPFGVRGGNKAQNTAAEAMELAILADHEPRASRSERHQDPAPANAAPSAPARSPKRSSTLSDEQPPAVTPSGNFTMVTRPVRSGQRVYAVGCDLSVIAPVSAGAELMADGNIHVYGPLRGRALAGMKGNTDARIFCQDLQAELVSIAGHYRVSENIPVELRGIPVQIFLEQKLLRIERI
ncbi:septum site-determining protein MinC [Thiocapsa imhoffii]|uniref:Probable septum site-determining protein MinC n=1 Tax=Thiocapsa imhoffii TaxID=382777 RepID=A0A9X1B9F7_9GAMM|nr:septum site-determining protein MinC [Thiocapsa imhoffii]MBK1645258.1 septum site-determining protein MinC [Thiocapsa imhoffii]